MSSAAIYVMQRRSAAQETSERRLASWLPRTMSARAQAAASQPSADALEPTMIVQRTAVLGHRLENISTVPSGNHVIQRTQLGDEAGKLATAFNSWLQAYAPNGGNQGDLQNLTQNHADAADTLQALLMSVGVDARPGDLGARAVNRLAFPRLAANYGILLQDMLTVLSDLRTYGGTQGFRPAQTITAVVQWRNAFGRIG